jgi:hypothetical protein
MAASAAIAGGAADTATSAVDLTEGFVPALDRRLPVASHQTPLHDSASPASMLPKLQQTKEHLLSQPSQARALPPLETQLPPTFPTYCV